MLWRQCGGYRCGVAYPASELHHPRDRPGSFTGLTAFAIWPDERPGPAVVPEPCLEDYWVRWGVYLSC